METIHNDSQTKVVSFREQTKEAAKDLMKGDVDLGIRKFNPDGTCARSRYKYSSINPNVYYDNRYKVSGKTLYVVTDTRAIDDQKSGRIYLKNIPAYKIKRDAKTNKLTLDERVLISDEEFIADFTHRLNNESMLEIHELIKNTNVSFGDNITI